MKCARIWFLLALLPLLAGCFSKIFSEQPLGEPAVLVPEMWNGRWLNSDGGVSTWTVVDTDTVASTAFGKSDGGLTSVCDPSPSDINRLSLRESQGWYILYEENGRTPISNGLYETTLLVRLEGRGMVVSFINKQRAKALVEQGELPGRIEASRVILGALTQEHYKLLFHNRGTEVEYPMAAKDDYPDVYFTMRGYWFLKLPDELDPCKKGDKGK